MASLAQRVLSLGIEPALASQGPHPPDAGRVTNVEVRQADAAANG